ncbi:hypothetical protein JCM3775_005112 [Rhodotorula graminis]
MAASLAASFESLHVHAVYDQIAADFSRTRHSRWPFVERFFERLPPGGLVLDAGTGNGKYLGCRSVLAWDGKAADSLPRPPPKGKARALEPANEPHDDESTPPPRSDLLPVGFDMSAGLLGIASAKGHEVVRGDCVDLSCWRRGAFNHAISIATVHHFATPARRVESVKQMILAVLPPSPPTTSSSSSTHSPSSPAPPPSKLLIVVWSVEQDPSLAARGGDRSARRTTGGKKGAVPVDAPLEGSREAQVGGEGAGERAGATGKGQDVFVPWERQEQVPRKRDKGTPRDRRPKMGPDPPAAGQASPASTPPSRDPAPEPATAAGDTAAPLDSTLSPPPAPAATDPKPTFNRYYHLFQQYELSVLVARAAQQLGLAFAAPDGYVLGDEAREGEAGEREGQDDDGRRDGGEVCARDEDWEAYVELEEERWERENWVVEVAVGWRRRLDARAAQDRA